MTPTHPRTLRSRRAGPWLAAAALSLACQAPPRARDEAGPEDKPATPAADPAKAADEPAPLSPIAPAGPHAFSVLDLLEMDRLSEPRVSHDGAQVVYTLRETDLVGNKARRSLWVVALAGGEPRPLETAANGQPADGSDPRWSSDGAHVYFVSKRSGSPQVWRAPITGGAATQVTALPVDVSGLKLSPRGDRLLVTAELFPDCDTLACTKQRLDARADDKVTGVRYEQLFVRHWDTWKDGRRAALLLAPTDGAAPVGDATILTRGLLADVPSKPFGGSEEYAFSPDGAHVVFTARRGDAREPWSTNFDLYRVAVDGDEPPQNLTEANLAWDTHPLFSADGRSLFYLAMARPGYEADRFRVVQQAFPMGERRVIAEGWDRSVSDMILAPDGASLYVVAQDLGHTPLFRVTLADGKVEKIVNDGTVSAPSIAGDHLVYLRNDLSHPDELYTAGLSGEAPSQRTHVNDALLSRVSMGAAEQFEFKGWSDERVYGWIVKPVDFKEGERYPLALLIHGGPQGSFGNRFHYRWNPQTYAGAGLAVVMIDFHGSTGYGQAFTDAIGGDWGGKPLVDLQKGLQAALARAPWIDGERACALGASYGGFMINWIAGNWPDRFRCLVNHDGIFDQRMMYYATEELWFPEWEHGGPYYQDPAAYERHNPAHHVTRWKTPMLVIHGSLDYRVPIEQGLATFTALQRRGIESEFLHYPDENHWVQKPANSEHWHRTVEAWLTRHLAPTGR